MTKTLFVEVSTEDGMISVHETRPKDIPTENILYEVPDDLQIPIDVVFGNCYIYEVLNDMGYKPINVH